MLAIESASYYPEFLRSWAEVLTKAASTLFLFQILYVLIQPVGDWVSEQSWFLSKTLSLLLMKIIRIVILVAGAATILEIFGIEIAPVLAGFGLLGVAVALGAQELFKNLIAGLMILSENRFNVGDIISVDNVITGVVEDIGLRSTLIRQYNLQPAFVPNCMLAENCMVNISKMTHRRIYWLIGLEYKSTHEQLMRVRDRIQKFLDDSEQFVSDKNIGCEVKIDQFSPSSIDIMVYCFTQETSWGEYLKAKENLLIAIKEIVEDEKASFAFPSQTIYVDKSEENVTFRSFTSSQNTP